MYIINVIMLLPLGLLKLINDATAKMKKSDKVESFLSFIYTLVMLVIFYKAFWPLDSIMKTTCVIAGIIIALSLGISIIIKTCCLVTDFFFEITSTPSMLYDNKVKSLKNKRKNNKNRKNNKGMSMGAKAEVGLQYFINLEKDKSYSNVKFF